MVDADRVHPHLLLSASPALAHTSQRRHAVLCGSDECPIANDLFSSMLGVPGARQGCERGAGIQQHFLHTTGDWRCPIAVVWFERDEPNYSRVWKALVLILK